jgi:hypothetical protein
MPDTTDCLYGKYTVRNSTNSSDEDGEFFVLRLGDPAADQALDEDPRLAVELIDRYAVVPAYAPTNTAPLAGCVALPITRPWPVDDEMDAAEEARRVYCVLLAYSKSVAESSPGLARDLAKILADVAPCYIAERAKRSDVETIAARARLKQLRMERIGQKAGAR